MKQAFLMKFLASLGLLTPFAGSKAGTISSKSGTARSVSSSFTIILIHQMIFFSFRIAQVYAGDLVLTKQEFANLLLALALVIMNTICRLFLFPESEEHMFVICFNAFVQWQRRFEGIYQDTTLESIWEGVDQALKFFVLSSTGAHLVVFIGMIVTSPIHMNYSFFPNKCSEQYSGVAMSIINFICNILCGFGPLLQTFTLVTYIVIAPVNLDIMRSKPSRKSIILYREYYILNKLFNEYYGSHALPGLLALMACVLIIMPFLLIRRRDLFDPLTCFVMLNAAILIVIGIHVTFRKGSAIKTFSDLMLKSWKNSCRSVVRRKILICLNPSSIWVKSMFPLTHLTHLIFAQTVINNIITLLVGIR